MSFSRHHRKNEQMDIWPGFVDALSTVLLVFIFVLVGFISSQIYLSGIIFDKDSSLASMRSKLIEACSLLSSEQSKSEKLITENSELLKKIEELNDSINTVKGMLDDEDVLLKKTKDEKATLSEKIDKLTKQLNDVLAALAAERKSSEEQKNAIETIKKENIKLSELSKMSLYRSEFFDKLQDIVRDRKGIRIAGDRFIFQSELFFDSASDELSEEGRKQVSEIAAITKEIGDKIPGKIRWILRVDGHTDKRPISGGKFASNWELSSARAISVVKYLIECGVKAEHLVAAGFGENQPISRGSSMEDFAKNRRIEFKLDER
ncbi:MAG: peptidoglycan-binding protein [Holosporales bacterium]|jgi:chemotaxis protein MotB|nr:peptidoglycan-binding protein [Holosporales bacterium]